MLMQKPKNILILIDAMPAGGMERQIVELLSGMHQLDAVVFHLGVLVKGGSRQLEAQKKVNSAVPFKQALNPSWDVVWRLPLLFVDLYRFVLNSNIEILHTFGCFSDLLGLAVGKTRHIPVINGSIRSARPKLMRRDRLSRFCMVRSDQIVANSRAGLLSFGFSPQKDHMHVIYNGVNLDRFSNIVPKKVGSGFTICMVANFTKKKDQSNLLKAFATLGDDLEAVNLLFIGRGETLAACRQMAAELSLSQRVTFLSECDYPEPYIAGSDIGILLTDIKVHGEGISNAILEYMALSKPVIATDFGGNVELVEHGKTGYLVKNNEPKKIAEYVARFYHDKKLAKTFGENGLKKLEQDFPLSKMISSYKKLYDKTVIVSGN